MTSESNMKPSPELAECLKGLHGALNAHIRIIDAVIAVMVEHESAEVIREETTVVDDVVASALLVMFQSLGSSANSLALLSEELGLQTRDCFSIARSVVELAVNICYIIAEGKPVAERAHRHARQKAYRDLDRESSVAGGTIHAWYSDGIPDDLPEDIEADIEEFTSRSGREKGWTDLSIDARIARAADGLDDQIATELHFARFMVYRHSSEILHGTLFGTLYFWGLTGPDKPQNRQEYSDHIGDLLMMILMAANLSLSSTIQAFHLKFGFQRAQGQSDAIFDEIRKLPRLSSTEADV